MKEKTEKNEKKNPFKKQIDNIESFVFTDENSHYIGVFVSKQVFKKPDGDTFQMNVFVDPKTGEHKLLSTNYSIEKAIDNASEDYPNTEVVFDITYLGKTTVKGKPFSRFAISTCPLQDYLDYIS